METLAHNLKNLFLQLGLDGSDEAISAFVHNNGPISPDIGLENAHFWTKSQAEFLTEALQDDSDWSEVVDELNRMMR